MTIINRPEAETTNDFANAPIIFAPVNEQTVLAVSRRLHDRKCRQGLNCGSRDWHALQGYEATVKDMLTVLADAQAASEI